MSEMPERIWAWLYTGDFNRGEWLGRKSVTTDVEYIRADLATLSSAADAEREPVAQFRKVGCSDWYDGLPDHQDGRGPYEERTLYLVPPPTSELEAENARLREAATALEAKAAELASERAAHAETRTMLDMEQERVIFIDATREAAEARLAEAMKALGPFARLPDFVDRNNWDDDAVVYFKNGRSVLNTVSLGDLRAARRVREGGKVDG